MLTKINENLKRNLEQESFDERKQRMLTAAGTGALIATAYVWTFFLINVYTFPSLPLAVDWARLLIMWIEFSLGFALFGAIAAWFTEEYMGIVAGGVIFTVLMGLIFLVSAPDRNGTVTAQSILMAFPLLGVSMLGAWALRWATHRYLAIQQASKPDRRKQMAKHILTIILVGLIPGILMRMDLPAQQSLGQLDELLQAAPNDPSVWPRLPLKQVPALQDHFGVDYTFYSRQSSISAGALDVTIRFQDGYVVSCFLPVGSGISFITQCNEGTRLQAAP